MTGEKKRSIGMPIMARLLLPIFLCVALAGAAVTYFWVSSQTATLEKAFKNEVTLAQTFLAPPVAAAVWDFNSDAALGAIRGLQEMETARFAQVVADGDIFAELTAEGADPASWAEGLEELKAIAEVNATLQAGDLALVKFPVLHTDGSQVAEILMGFDVSGIAKAERTLLLNTILASVVVIAILAVIGYISTASVTTPLKRIISRIDALREGDTEGDVPAVERKDELGRLGRAVEEFVDTIKANKSMEDQARASAREQSEVVNELADGLNHLAQGELSHRITTTFSADYEMLRADFNKTAAALDDVIGRVLGTISQIESETGEMAEGTQNLAKRTESQAATLEETAAAISSITDSVQTASDQTKSVETTVDATKSEALRGGEIVKSAVDAMQDIKESAGKISEINRVIEDISFQTNLLALNAGVEAARAGDSGRGFAVVASEVRSLALRSATSAHEIKELIDTSSDQVEIGVDLVDQAGKAIEEIITKIQEVSRLAVQIAESSRDQATAITEINSGVMDLDRVTQQNASLVDRSSAQGRALQEAASELAELVASFRPSAVLGSGSFDEAGDSAEDVEFRRTA